MAAFGLMIAPFCTSEVMIGAAKREVAEQLNTASEVNRVIECQTRMVFISSPAQN